VYLVGADVLFVDEPVEGAHQEVLAPVSRQRVQLDSFYAVVAAASRRRLSLQAANALDGPSVQEVDARHLPTQLAPVSAAESLEQAGGLHPLHRLALLHACACVSVRRKRECRMKEGARYDVVLFEEVMTEVGDAVAGVLWLGRQQVVEEGAVGPVVGLLQLCPRLLLPLPDSFFPFTSAMPSGAGDGGGHDLLDGVPHREGTIKVQHHQTQPQATPAPCSHFFLFYFKNN
jgi:hypothetical protein